MGFEKRPHPLDGRLEQKSVSAEYSKSGSLAGKLQNESLL